jgi:hypothetical protein
MAKKENDFAFIKLIVLTCLKNEKILKVHSYFSIAKLISMFLEKFQNAMKKICPWHFCIALKTCL